MNLLAAVWIYRPLMSDPRTGPVSLGSLEVNRRGTLDFGGGAAGDHRLHPGEEVRTEGAARHRVCPARVLSRLLDGRSHDQRGDHEHRGHDRQHQLLTAPVRPARLSDRPRPAPAAAAGRAPRRVGSMTELPDRRLLLVHAHPDDESINNGATMARYAAEGAQVTLVTCTLGEEGEVIPPGLAHLAPDREGGLGPYRIGELAAAMKELGVTDHRFLGGPGRYRDSGMMGTEQNRRPGAFWSADVDEAAGHLVEVIREVRPQVLVTYDPDGGYGHPDHIQAHRVAMRAAELAAQPSFRTDLGEPWE